MHRQNFFAFIKSIFLMQIFLLILISGVSLELNSQYLRTLPSYSMDEILMPLSQINIDEKRAAYLFKEVNVVFGGEENKSPQSITYFRDSMPKSLMVSNIQALAYVSGVPIASDYEGEDIDIESPVDQPETEPEKPVLDKDYSSLFKNNKVVFYCTHSAESYIPDSGSARSDGQRGLVNNVAATMADSLGERGLEASFINTIHDYPDYNSSYTKSRQTVMDVTKSQKNLLALFDVHRDSIPGVTSGETVEFEGRKAARILIIVGTDERKPHPKWQENLQFAQKIFLQAEKTYPGLIKGVRTKAGTYNQEFFNNSLLLEMGSDYNSLAEASYAGELFSDVLLEVLKEEV